MSVKQLELSPIFRSDTQVQVLAEVLWGEPTSGRGLARRLDIAQPTVARELARLEAAGIVRTEPVGTARIVYPTDSPAIAALRQLVAYAAGAPHAIRSILTIEGIDEVFIFGSWAARFHGEPGQPPGDIDIAVVSRTLTRFDLAEQRIAIGAATGMSVDLHVFDPDNERLDDLRSKSVPVIERHP